MPGELVGFPSDEVPGVRATGDGDITTLFVSMAERHPNSNDAGYLRWHALDHRPEQHRLSSVRASLRVVSTPACRAARAASGPGFDAIDHVLAYFFTGIAGLTRFKNLSIALNSAGRVPFVLKPVQRGVYTVVDKIAAPRVKAGADVLPWVPMKGVYILLGTDTAPPADLIKIAGVAGVWSGVAVANEFSNAQVGQKITYCFLDDDPVAVAERLQPVLAKRWSTKGSAAPFAAPFHAIVPYEWDRFVP
jgi:hypothetical protein